MKKISFTLLLMIVLFVNLVVLIYNGMIFLDTKQVNTLQKHNLLVEHENKEDIVLETFYGELTAYGVDCVGCSGITASGYNLLNNNLRYFDNEYGNLMVVASDRRYPFGTIIKVTETSFFKNPFYVIVLDRGGLIQGDILDLAFNSEKDEVVGKLGRRKNVKYEVVRYGY